jgi:dehydrogenase/reductase SDR family protein 7B
MKKTILITGASSGIGEALAVEWAKQKHIRLILAARDLERLEKTREQCVAQGAEAIVIGMDLSNGHSIEKAVQEIESRFAAIDIVVHNGGISQRSTVNETIMAVYRKLMEVNFMGTVHLTKLLLPRMLERKSGHWVVVTSVVGKIGTPVRSGYAASKHALHGFFDSLRAEVCHSGLKVTIVCPGYVRTNLSLNALSSDGAHHSKMDETTANGLDPAFFARKMIAAVEAGKEEVVIAGFRETLGVYLKRFMPGLLSRIVSKAKVT